MAIKSGMAVLAALVVTNCIVIAAAQGTPQQVIIFDNKGKLLESSDHCTQPNFVGNSDRENYVEF